MLKLESICCICLCNFLVIFFQGGSFIVSSLRNRLLRASVDSAGKLHFRELVQGQGVLSGIGRRVSSLFGTFLSPPANETVREYPKSVK